MASHRLVSFFTDLFFVCFGTWTLVEQSSYLFGWTFQTMVTLGSGLMLLAAVITYFSCYSQNDDKTLSTREVIALVFLVLSAVVLTLCMHRPDPDDKHYLTLAIGVLDFPNTPLSRIPPLATIEKHYLLTSYDMFRAGVSYITGIPILSSYYLVVPGFFSIFAILIHYRLLRTLTSGGWIAGLIFFLLVMVAWGDDHRTHANFGLVRLFQGKACFVTIVVPGMFYYFFQYVQTASWRSIVLLFFALAGGVGFTLTGVSIGIMTLLLLFISTVRLERQAMKQNLLGLLPSLLPLVIGVLLILHFGASGEGVHTAHGIQSSTTTFEMIKFVMGEGPRGLYAMFCFIISPLLIDNQVIKKKYRNFVIICLMLLVFPGTSNIVAKLSTGTGAWRWLWCIPFPLVMALAAAKISRIDYTYVKGPVVFVVLCVIFYFSSHRNGNVISDGNYTKFGWPKPKLENQEEVDLYYYGTGTVENGRIHLKGNDQAF